MLKRLSAVTPAQVPSAVQRRHQGFFYLGANPRNTLLRFNLLRHKHRLVSSLRLRSDVASTPRRLVTSVFVSRNVPHDLS